MLITMEQLRGINFLGNDEIHRCSGSYLNYSFQRYLKRIGADIDTTNSTEKLFYVDIEDPNELFKLLHPDTPWEHYFRVNCHNYPYSQRKPRTDAVIDYYLENHLGDNEMILFDSGHFAYVGFKTKANAVQFKLTVL